MPQPKKAARFGGKPAHHNMILANLATELLRHGQIRTTHAKAKTVQPVAERMITFAKRGDLHSRRQVLKVVRDRDVVHKLFTDVGPAFADRDGGYTRILRLGPRKGDAAPMALISLVEGVAVGGEGELEEAPRRRWSLRRRRGTQSVTARERSEARAALADRGEEPEPSLEEEELEATVEEPTEDAEEERTEADPAEVEARLAAEEADEAKASEALEEVEVTDTDEGEPVEDAPKPSGEQDAPAPERPPTEGPTTPTSDEPEGGQDSEKP